MPDLAVMTGLQPQTIWIAAALLVVLLAMVVVAKRSDGSSGFAALFGIPVLVAIAWGAWSLAEQSALRYRLAEREALNTRALQLTTAALNPGSAMACLDSGITEPVEASCEAAVFLKPENVAAATAYAEARLRLLTDGLDYARRADGAYADRLVHLRRGLEADRYGFVAHVLATRDGCTPETCEAFALLGDATTVKRNLAARTLEDYVARYAATWSGQAAPAAAVAVSSPAALPLPGMASPAETIAGVSVTTGSPAPRPIDFPTSASIPPVSIMTEPPGASASAAEAPPVRRPAAAASPAAPARPH
jgi:hypothetical protein